LRQSANLIQLIRLQPVQLVQPSFHFLQFVRYAAVSRCRDAKTGRHRQTRPVHFSQIGTLPSDKRQALAVDFLKWQNILHFSTFLSEKMKSCLPRLSFAKDKSSADRHPAGSKKPREGRLPAAF
jgi:hypothetical protein